MMSKTSLAFFNEPVLRGWCGFWIAPQPHRLGGPQARITRVVSTGDFSWPHAGTFTWPRTPRRRCRRSLARASRPRRFSRRWTHGAELNAPADMREMRDKAAWTFGSFDMQSFCRASEPRKRAAREFENVSPASGPA